MNSQNSYTSSEKSVRKREMEGVEQRKHRRLVLVPGPFQGHLTPMLQLGTILHSRGFSITIAHTKFNHPHPSSHPDFHFLCIEDRLSKDEVQSRDLVSLVLTLNTKCEQPLREFLAQDRIACVFYDALMYFSESAARPLKIPSVILHTNSAASSLARSFLHQLKALGFIPLQESMLQDPVPQLQPLRFKDLPISHFGRLEDHLQLISLAGDIRTSSALVWNTLECLEESPLAQLREDYRVPIFSLGPLNKLAPAGSSSSSTGLLEEDNACISWLDKQCRNSVIYISLGSIASIDDRQLMEMAWGLANSGQPFLWVVRPNLVRGSEWSGFESLSKGFKEIVEERGCIVKWAPQRRVLSHGSVGGFWSHCGWNSTLESICEGVPMIRQPCFGDQRVNARYLTSVWKVGYELGDGENDRRSVEKAIRELMVGTQGEEMRQRMSKLKDKVEVSIQEGGSSYGSLERLIEFLQSI
ncbi:UDP-glucose iridoid glucosyltransferase-like [Punica granatum]|uniref:UDP-glucose iridoid glucosyltransferase-like n=1 Tax=Punica granatum TaxID=22663 RepID=A0A218W989_PUNGR|nr:UDP-glucose iridoid glucosyltransferase-like [Punica granatum]OWM68771.1 hypothetical protein CDL15_Pgr024958 [Punica granatum]